MLIPVTAFWNKDYQSERGTLLKRVLLEFNSVIDKLLSSLGYARKSDLNIFFADDLFVSVRNLGFLSDPLFIRAVGPRSTDKILMGRIWRLWILSWSLASRWKTKGIILDLGTYNGKAMFTACKYAALVNPDVDKSTKKIYLADLFVNPPIEARKSDHGKNLANEVRLLFQSIPGLRVIEGEIPSSLASLNFDEGISWCQIDLNSSTFDLAAFETIYPYLMPGSHVIFDDYGFSRYKKTQLSLDKFLREKSETICELPTGQGLFIKS